MGPSGGLQVAVVEDPTIGRCWEDLVAQPRDENWSHEDYLATVPATLTSPQVSVPRRTTSATDDQPAAVRVLDRLLAAGLSDERAAQHLHAGRVQVDGELVTDPHTPARPPARVVIGAA